MLLSEMPSKNSSTNMINGEKIHSELKLKLDNILNSVNYAYSIATTALVTNLSSDLVCINTEKTSDKLGVRLHILNTFFQY